MRSALAAPLALLLGACQGAGDPRPSGAPAEVAAPPVLETPPPALEAAPPDDEPAAPAANPAVWITGDVLLSEAVRDSMNATDDPAGAYAEVLAPIRRLWDADPGGFVLVNLETPVARIRRRALDSAEPVSRGFTPVYLQGPPWLPEALARAGVDGVMLANNHALDQEREGLAETIASCERAGLVVTGAGHHPQHRWPIVLGDEERPGGSLAVLAFYDAHDKFWVDPGEAARSFLDEEAPDLVARAAERHRVVVVVHFVGELREVPLQRWRQRVDRLIAAGADAIIAHGTHVPMRVERVQGVPVAWGLGNFVADMGRQANPRHHGEDLPKIRSPKTREGLVARVELRDGELELSFLPTWSGDDRFVRWHAGLPGEEVAFTLSPLSACGRALELPAAWPEPWRGEVADWIDRRRDHLVRVSGLVPRDCREGEPTWLELP
ncbi:MAG: hypothetical protein CMN30_08530 [Sandaracinus sp.]|nr:hypothetical protein [Sandaracinus sp.]